MDVVDKKEQKSDGKLILAEEIVQGRITWKALKLFVDGLGGKYTSLIMTVWIVGLVATHISMVFGVWFIGYWGSQYETRLPEQVQVS